MPSAAPDRQVQHVLVRLLVLADEVVVEEAEPPRPDAYELHGSVCFHVSSGMSPIGVEGVLVVDRWDTW